LDDLERSYRKCAMQIVHRASFRTHHGNLKEDRPILLAPKNVAQGLYFETMFVHANTRGVPWRGASNDSGVYQNCNF